MDAKMHIHCAKLILETDTIEDASFDVDVPETNTFDSYHLAIVEYIMENYIDDVAKDTVKISWGYVKSTKNGLVFRFTVPPPYVI